MDFTAKMFEELTLDELYAVIKARLKVFVVEQGSVYLDLDGVDKESLHVFSLDSDGECTAYMRAYPHGQDTVKIGRVLTVRRGERLGGRLLRFGMDAVIERFSPKKLYIESQTHAVGFYEREGFRVVSEEFDIDGIPHVRMELEL